MLRLRFKEAFALLFLFSASFTQAFYFYLEGGDPKCFLEDLPNETVVAAKYRVEKFDENTQSYVADSLFQVSLAVNKDDESQPLVSQKLGTEGKFSFTSHSWGNHHICFTNPSSGSWIQNSKARIYLDLFVGSEAIETTVSNSKLNSLESQARVINYWLDEILKDMKRSRDKESEYQDETSKGNSRLTLWIFFQLAFIIGTGYWQVTHLRRFFVNKKVI